MATTRDDLIRAHIAVFGRVQGVCYRDFTQRSARDSGLVGWVRNLPDGSVEAVVEGPRGVIEGLIAAMRQGPPASRVADLRVTRSRATREFRDFSIHF